MTTTTSDACDDDDDDDNGGRRRRGSASTREAGAMRCTAEMMEEHRRSQEASERAAAIIDELSSALIMGRSAAGPGGGEGILGIGGGEATRRGGVRVTFNGLRRPVAVDVDPRFLFLSSSSSSSSSNVNGGGVNGGGSARGSGGVISAEELNDAIADAMRDGYERSAGSWTKGSRGCTSSWDCRGIPRRCRPPRRTRRANDNEPSFFVTHDGKRDRPPLGHALI